MVMQDTLEVRAATPELARDRPSQPLPRPGLLGRMAFVLVPVLTGVGGLALGVVAWGPTWPALLVGCLIGAVLGGALQLVLFPGRTLGIPERGTR
jgi:hypothetical protein